VRRHCWRPCSGRRASGHAARTVCAIGVLASSLLSLLGCAAATSRNRPALHTALRRLEAGLTPEEQERADRNCGEFGIPKTDPAWPFGQTKFIFRDGYVLQHSSLDKIPLWVCEGIVPEQLSGTATRDSGTFKPDLLLPAGKRAELADYKGSGYDRGHQAPAGDQVKEQRLKDETFYLSNMAPQVPAHNQQIWRVLEDTVRNWVKDGNLEVEHVITGGFFYDPAEDDAQTADGEISFKTVGQGQVSVPTHFFKIVLGRTPGGEWQAIGFVIENKGFTRPFNFASFIKPIDWIEERTGLDFLPELGPEEEERLERAAPPLWFQ
jgi:endonuclease G